MEQINLDDFEEVPPSISMVESIRSFGYNFNTAIADLLDNSITANASKIDIHLEWNNGDPFVAILDNGDAMNDATLSKNVILGSRNLHEERDKNDLGRFGLGLKTASFSMARELHIFSKTKKDKICYRSWDLNIVEKERKWLVSKKLPYWYDDLNPDLKIKNNGTLILWKNCDRLLKNASNLKSFQAMGVDLISYLGAIFNRYISFPTNLEITVNQTIVEAWNPIPQGSRSLGEQFIQNIKITPYILPHQSHFENSDDYKSAGGINGWNLQQGFYVYRNKRLIVNGGWLGLKRMKVEEHIKLARIIVDIDTNYDLSWQIDVMKSRASIPSGEIKNFLEGIAKDVRKRADNVYRHRGKIVSRQHAFPDVFVWRQKEQIDKSKSFVINRKHPIIAIVKENYSGRKTDIDKLLNLIEKTLPIEAVQSEMSSGSLNTEIFSYEEVKELTERALEGTDSIGKSRKNAIEDLVRNEPWINYKEQLIKDFS